MNQLAQFDAWSAGQNYEQYMGRWSRLVATKFLSWLAPPQGAHWLEVGCGTGAFTAQILKACAPASVLATDPSKDFVAYAQAQVIDQRLRFDVADGLKLPAADRSIDVVASALVLNFIPNRSGALAEMKRVLRPRGLLAFYVWDYPGGGMGFIDAFWKAAAEIDPQAAELDEGRRFPFCTQAGLTELCREAGIAGHVEPIEIETVFKDFDSFWQPFTLGAGPAPGYCMKLPEDQRARLKATLAGKLGTQGPVRLIGRAWAVKGT